MLNERDFAAASEPIERADRIMLVCHRKPDGDALGTTMGLGLSLEQQGKHVAYLCADPVPQRYRFLPGVEKFTASPPKDRYDLLVILDCAADHLTGLDLSGLFPGVPIVDIDHHPKVRPLVSMRTTLYDHQASSTAELVFRLLQHAGWPVTRHTATALLTGIISDTAAFQNGNTRVDSLRTAAQLLRRGAKLKQIVTHCFFTSSVPKLRLWGTAMARIEQNPDAAGIVSTVITYDDIVECGAHPDDVEGLVNFLNAIPGVPALMLLTDLQQGEIKGSLRTREGQIDVSKLARRLGGGGHKQAAGFSVPGRLARNPDDSWEVLPT